MSDIITPTNTSTANWTYVIHFFLQKYWIVFTEKWFNNFAIFTTIHKMTWMKQQLQFIRNDTPDSNANNSNNWQQLFSPTSYLNTNLINDDHNRHWMAFKVAFYLLGLLFRRVCNSVLCVSTVLLVRGKMIDDFSGPDCRFLSAKKSENVYVYYKLGGRRSDIWAGSVSKFLFIFNPSSIMTM